MHDLSNFKSLIHEFVISSAPAYAKLEALAGILKLARRSHTPELNEIAAEFEQEAVMFTKDIMARFAERIEQLSPSGPQPTYAPSGLLSELSKKKKKSANAELEHLQVLIAMANELDKTGDPELIKEASVLDEILLSLAAPRGAQAAFKLAEDQEIQRLRDKYREESLNSNYKSPTEELEKDIKQADAVKAIENSVKEYRPLEAALTTRTCPDHPGAQMARIADSIYQCSLDKKVYNYQGGFTTMKGSKVPGSDVSAQTQALGDRAIEHMSFDTRESKLNP